MNKPYSKMFRDLAREVKGVNQNVTIFKCKDCACETISIFKHDDEVCCSNNDCKSNNVQNIGHGTFVMTETFDETISEEYQEELYTEE